MLGHADIKQTPRYLNITDEELRKAMTGVWERRVSCEPSGSKCVPFGRHDNEALVLKTEAGRLQAEASDQWAYYQAKGIKGAVQDAVRTTWIAVGKPVPATVEQSIQRYAAEEKDIERAAREKEHERDEKSREADELLERHHRCANSVALLQVAIALGAVAALTRQRVIWGGSAILGVLGVSLFLFTAWH